MKKSDARKKTEKTEKKHEMKKTFFFTTLPATHSSFEDVHPSPEHCDRGKEKNISNICDFEMLQTGRSTPAISCTDPEDLLLQRPLGAQDLVWARKSVR